MKILKVYVTPYEKSEESNLKALVSLELSGGLALRHIKVVAKDGNMEDLRVQYPLRQLRYGDTRYFYYPCTPEATKYFETAILEAFKLTLENPGLTEVTIDAVDDEPLEVTNAKVYPFVPREGSAMRAKVSVELGGMLRLRNMALVTRPDGSLGLNLPHWRDSNSNPYHPLTTEARSALTEAVIPFYDEAVREMRAGQSLKAA